MPTKQLEHPAQEEKLLAGPYNSRSYVSGTQQMVQESPLTENDFHQSLEPETMIIKLKKRLKNSFPNSAELFSYSLSWKANWVTKLQVYSFGSATIINAASQCPPGSGSPPVRVRFPPWCCAGAKASESSEIALCTNVKDFPVWVPGRFPHSHQGKEESRNSLWFCRLERAPDIPVLSGRCPPQNHRSMCELCRLLHLPLPGQSDNSSSGSTTEFHTQDIKLGLCSYHHLIWGTRN